LVLSGLAVFGLGLLAGCSRELPAERAALATSEPASLSSARASVPSAASVAFSASPPLDAPAPAADPVAQGAPGVAVIELFTSEGCSSCPPADRVLASLTARAKAESLPVYTLSFHVDYWNYLGWQDRFSRSEYSERQRGYSSINAGGGTYTPQAVINGDTECVGSNSSRMNELVGSALKRASRAQIALDARRVGQGVDVTYHVTGQVAGRVLNLALLEPRAQSQVESGENAGERLAHVNVVRSFVSRALNDGSAGHFTLTTSSEFDAGHLAVVAYVEDASQRDISGATALELP
jgi:hypothetical protein